MSIVLMGSTSGSITLSEPAVAGSNTISLPAVTGTVVVAGQNSAITAGTAVASTSGTSIDFTSIPSWVKKITIMLAGVSTSGSSNIRFQVGSSTVSTSGYSGAAIGVTAGQATSGTNGTNLSGLDVYVFSQSAAYLFQGNVVWTLVGSNTWTVTGTVATSNATSIGFFGGASPALGGALDRVRITTVNGTDTFDAGSINILYE